MLPPSKNFDGKTGFGCMSSPQPVKLFDLFREILSCLFFLLLLLAFPNFAGCLLLWLPPADGFGTADGGSSISAEDMAGTI